jgi:hypothetical protein
MLCPIAVEDYACWTGRGVVGCSGVHVRLTFGFVTSSKCWNKILGVCGGNVFQPSLRIVQ